MMTKEKERENNSSESELLSDDRSVRLLTSSGDQLSTTRSRSQSTSSSRASLASDEDADRESVGRETTNRTRALYLDNEPDYRALYHQLLAKCSEKEQEERRRENEWSRERRALQRRVSELEEELKQLDGLRNENVRLRDENGALIRVISKLSK